jgi:hypothetical protein
MMETKPCIECGRERPFTDFQPARARICKTCRRARVRMERRLHGHRDQVSPSVEETP